MFNHRFIFLSILLRLARRSHLDRCTARFIFRFFGRSPKGGFERASCPTVGYPESIPHTTIINYIVPYPVPVIYSQRDNIIMGCLFFVYHSETVKKEIKLVSTASQISQ